MNFMEAVNDVLTLVKRPDKEAEARKAVNAAIAFFTLKGEFRMDQVEASIAIDSTLYGDTIALDSLTRFRRFTYVKRYGAKGYLSPMSPEKIFTPGGQMQPNVYYTVGTNLTYVLNVLSDSLEVGYLQYGPTLVSADNHWMLDMMPTMITDFAAAKIFRSIGDDNSADRHDNHAREAFKVLVNDQALGA